MYKYILFVESYGTSSKRNLSCHLSTLKYMLMTLVWRTEMQLMIRVRIGGAMLSFFVVNFLCV